MGSALPLISRRAALGAAIAGFSLPGWAKANSMRVRFTFADQVFAASLDDNPSAREFAAMLPLDLTIEDYADNEKIAHLPRKLSQRDAGPIPGEAPGDLCYYAPWGNLAFFHGGYRYSSGLIRLGRLEGGVDPLLKRGKFALRAEHAV